MDPTYAEVGTEVVVGFTQNHYYSCFVRDSLPIKTTITQVHAEGGWCRVKADGSKYWWPVDDMILASDISLLLPEQKSRINEDYI